MTIPTRERLIESAIRRVYRDGFRSVGIDQILTDVGISKTAFYKHFDSKEDLMLAALDKQHQWLLETFRAMICERGGPTPLSRLHAVFDVVERLIESEGFQGCIFVNAAMEFPLPHEPAHVAAAENKQAIEGILCQLAHDAGAADPVGLARELCLVIEGTYITRQVSGDSRTIDIARRIARLLIENQCPAVAGTVPLPA